MEIFTILLGILTITSALSFIAMGIVMVLDVSGRICMHTMLDLMAIIWPTFLWSSVGICAMLVYNKGLVG